MALSACLSKLRPHRPPCCSLYTRPQPRASVRITSLPEYSPDICPLYVLMSIRAQFKHHLLTSSPQAKEHLNFSALLCCSLLYNPFATCIMFICSSSTTVYAHEGGILSVLFIPASLKLRKAPGNPLNSTHPINTC